VAEGRILVVDDDPQTRRVMRTSLVEQEYEVADARSGQDVLDRVRAERYDLVVLDLDLPWIAGLDTCRKIRMFSEVPIIVTTARAGEKDKVAGLDAGADDYVAKPFSMPEMLARIRATLRRKPQYAEQGTKRVRLGKIEIDFLSRRVITPTKQLRLTSKEFDLLSYLAAHPNRPITHRELLHAVWGPEFGEQHEYLRVFINRLRKKIESSPKEPKYLLKEPWVGYRLEVPPE
jgi:two-component system KDP operon response regulator KdpE